jgi:hypothetical protein
MSLTDTETDLTLTPERPSQRSLDPTQPTAEEQAARAREVQARGGQPMPPQPGPGIAFARLGPTNPAQVAAIQPQIPQTPAPGEPAAEPGQDKKLASLDPGAAAAPAAVPDYNANQPAVYRPPSPNRSPTELGDDWFPTKAAQTYPGIAPGPDMPTPQESYRVAADASNRMATWGSDQVSGAYSQSNLLMNPLAAIADAFSKGRFSQNFSAANLRGLQIQQYEALAALQRATELHQTELAGANRIANLEAAGLINQPTAERMMRDYLIQTGHQKYIPILDSHGIKGVWKLYQIEDAAWRQAHAGQVTLQKALDTDSNNATLRSWGFEPGSGGTADMPGMTGGPEDKTAPGGPKTPAGSAPPLEGELATFNDLPPDAQNAAREIYNGNPVPGLTDLGKSGPGGAAAVDKINQMARALDSRVNRIAQYQKPGTDADELGQQKLDAIKRTDAKRGALIEGLKNLTIDPNDASLKGNARENAIVQTQQVFPGWNRNMFHQFSNVWNNGNSQENRQIEAGNRGTTQAVLLEAAINRIKIPEDSTIPANVWNEWKTQGYTSDPQFAALNEPLRAFAGEMVFLQTGRVNVTPVTQFLKEAPLHGGKAQLRTLLRQAMIGGMHTMEQKRGVFNRQTGLSGDPPAADPDAMMLYSVFARSNPNTGKFPKDAPSELLSIQPSPADMAKRPSWRTQEQEFEPMTREEYGGLKATVDKMRRDNPNDPRLPKLMHELGIAQ